MMARWLQGMPFSIAAAIGFVALSGIAMLNGPVLVDHISALRQMMPLADAVRQAARARRYLCLIARPIPPPGME